MLLNVQHRENTGKAFNRRLRKQGRIPCIIYGKGKPVLVSIETNYAYSFIKSIKGVTKLIQLNLESQENTEQRQVIIKDYQMSNWGNHLLHIDFLEVSDDSMLSLELPVKVINESICPAIKNSAVLQVIRWTIPVRCMAKNIPDTIAVDVQNLQFGENIHVLDLEYPEGVTPIVKKRNFTVLIAGGRMTEETEETEETVQEADVEEAVETDEQTADK